MLVIYCLLCLGPLLIVIGDVNSNLGNQVILSNTNLSPRSLRHSTLLKTTACIGLEKSDKLEDT
jgi:hypothetical protein